MTRRISLWFLALLVLAALVPTPVLAHPGHDHKVLGTVTMAASDHVMLKDREGKDHTVHITAETKILKDKKAATVQDIQAGMRIVVTAVEQDDKMMAKTIELGAAPTAK
ncbi:MAG: hypothetical protein OEW19_22635 [Acidobacteriota bacterium]|nr:hypothetical protein [Acidobacteriota bacterium]